jgi:hypothetical protein
MTETAAETLAAEFVPTSVALGRPRRQGRGRVGVSWPAVPVELLDAAGFDPVFFRAESGPTPLADPQLEPGVFSPRLRGLVEAALTGALGNLDVLVIPRTSDQDYKGFLYLKELVRLGAVSRSMPPMLLLDLPQSDGPWISGYGRARLANCLDQLEGISGRRVVDADVLAAIERANAARAAARDLLALRRGSPRLSGTEALPLLGAWWQAPPARYADLAAHVHVEISSRRSLDGPRLLLLGTPVETTSLHRAIEGYGAVVVTEASPWGSRALGRDVSMAGDPLSALFEKYRHDVAGPREPLSVFRRWLQAELDAPIDGVVIWLSTDDSVFGWDYAHIAEECGRRNLPCARVMSDSEWMLDEASVGAVGACARAAALRGQGAGRG